jgi:hypothetical protein
MKMNEAYTTSRESLIQMFLDAAPNESYNEGRLVTRQSGESTVELIAYGWNKLAEYNETTDTVTLFGGHVENISETVDDYAKAVFDTAQNRESRTINVVVDAAPNVAEPPAESVRFINNYKSFSGSDSPVESWASETVDRAVNRAAEKLL